MASISTTINTTQGVVSSLDETPEITFGSDTSVVFSGSVDFSAASSVTGVVADPNVEETDDPSISSPETYNCANGVRAFRVVAALGGAWTIAAITNLSISNGQSTTVKVLGSTAADRTVTLTGMTVNGVAATVNPATVKAKQKGSGIALDVVKSGGSYFVFGSSLASE